ncbi:MAG: peptidoglycan D,D-transpeptidase FtsI family protein [Rubrivivax sp.]
MKPTLQAGARAVNYATSPLLASKTPPWRSRFMLVMVALAFVVLAGRAVYIQAVGTDFYVKQGEMRYARTLVLPASRGRILDRHGVVLATSVPAPSVWAIPKDFEADVAQRKALAGLLGMTLQELKERTAGDGEFAWLRRQVDDAVWAEVKALGIKGVHRNGEFKRRYPEGEAAAHVVGFTDVEESGQEGIELAFQKDLQGKPGSRGVLRDRLGRIVEDTGAHLAPVNGRDVTLSIDSKVQFFAWQRVRDAVAAQGAKAGSVVVLDARSGEVLALANYPSFNPNQRQNLSGAQLRNRALTDIFEPGSTMKPFIAAWALESGRVTPQTLIQTAPGSITITGSTIKDAHPHGVLSVAEVIQKSSNVGTVKMAMQMSPREMWELYAGVGFGQKPQLDFPGAVTGKLRPYKTWRPIEQATMSYGYGVSASLLQLARAYTVFARDGELIPVSMLKRQEPVAGLRVISPRTARDVREMLRMAAGPGGTAQKAQTIGYSVGGKTGTARKQEGKSYTSNKYRAWFVGLAPVSDPRIVVAVMVDEPSKGVFYGGDVAAPVFSEVVQQTLRMMGVATDIEVKPQIVFQPGAAEVESF